MEEELKVKVPERRGTRVICRSGSPMDLDDLRLSSHETARSVILLAPESDDPDSEVIKTLLALTHAGPDGPRIVAEIQDPSNLEAAAWSARAGPPCSTSARPWPSSSCRPRASPARRPSTPSCSTTTATSSTSSRTTGWPGRRTPRRSRPSRRRPWSASSTAATSKLNPPPDTVLTAEQTLIVVVEDDSALEGQSRSHDRARPQPAGPSSPPTSPAHPGAADRLERARADRAARARPLRPARLDADRAHGVRRARRARAAQPRRHRGQGLHRPTARCWSEHVAADLDQIIVLCYTGDLEAQAADARTLVDAAARARHPAQGRARRPRWSAR